MQTYQTTTNAIDSPLPLATKILDCVQAYSKLNTT